MKFSGRSEHTRLDEVVAGFRPVAADELAAKVVPHAAGPRREQRHVGAPVRLELELAADAGY